MNVRLLRCLRTSLYSTLYHEHLCTYIMYVCFALSIDYIHAKTFTRTFPCVSFANNSDVGILPYPNDNCFETHKPQPNGMYTQKYSHYLQLIL